MKLHELIELSWTGKKFRATHRATSLTYSENDFYQDIMWRGVDITANWEIRYLPEVVKFSLDCTTLTPPNALNSPTQGPSDEIYEQLDGRKWRMVCTEVLEGDL